MADKHVCAVTVGSIATVIGVVIAGVGLFSNNKASVSGSTVQSGGSLFGSVTQNISNPLPPKPAAGSPEEAKAKLREDGLEFSPKAFGEAAAEQSPEVVDLYLDAGMSPNATFSDTSGMFVLAEGINNNPSAANGFIDVFKKHNVDFSEPSPSYQSPLIPHGATTTMQDEVFGFAMGQANPDLIRHLVRAGANPRATVSFLESECNRWKTIWADADARLHQPYAYPYGQDGDNASSARGMIETEVVRANAFRQAGVKVQGCGPNDIPSRENLTFTLPK